MLSEAGKKCLYFYVDIVILPRVLYLNLLFHYQFYLNQNNQMVFTISQYILTIHFFPNSVCAKCYMVHKNRRYCVVEKSNVNNFSNGNYIISFNN